MKIIDKTPLLDEKGELGILQRVQGMLRFGFNWPNQLAVQKAIISFLDRQLEKGYTLIRNMPLGESGIIVPIILLGPAGIFAINIADGRGRYQASGESWNVDSGNGYKPAPINLVQQTRRLSRALRAYLEWQGYNVPVNIESVLIAGDPGMHIESERPVIRVMMIDGIKSFVSGLGTGRPALNVETVHEVTERILNPRPPKKEPAAPPGIAGEREPTQPRVSRARAIFDAAEDAKPFDPADFDFAMTDEGVEQDIPFVPRETSPAEPLPPPKGKRILGMTIPQLAVILVLGLCLILLAAAFVYVIFFFS